MDIYSLADVIPLSFSRVRAGQFVTGLTVSVDVKNSKNGAQILASTACPEVAPGIYTYQWTHGLTQDTVCLVTYTVGTAKLAEYIFITNDAAGGRVAY